VIKDWNELVDVTVELVYTLVVLRGSGAFTCRRTRCAPRAPSLSGPKNQ